MELLGIIGALIVTYSNIPQIWLFIKNGNANGISRSGTWIALIGLGLRTVYLAKATSFDAIALGPYVFAIACVVLTLYYCYFPRVDEKISPVKLERQFNAYEFYLSDKFDRGNQ